jgi:lysophospholipase L1-like esterase
MLKSALFLLFLGCGAFALHAQTGPTPYPDPKNEAAWPGAGPIRNFPYMAEYRKSFWKRRETDQGAVVFVGDSLTAKWAGLKEAFPGMKIANRGITADTSRGVLFRFKEDVLELKPSAIILLAGTNDLSAHGEPALTERNLAAMLDQAREADPGVPIILCIPPPSGTRKARPDAPADLNARIAQLGAAREKLAVLDLFTLLGTPEGTPVPEYFVADQVHLSPAGYEKWREALVPAMEKLGIK